MLKGKVHKYGANVDTDAIIPARYLNVSDPDELAKHCMEDMDADFLKKVEPGDIIMATTNFGCGSSREHAPLAIKAAGVSCIIASSFARIFFRNAINIGLPLLGVRRGGGQDRRRRHAGSRPGQGQDKKPDQRQLEFKAKPYPDFMAELIADGGLIEHTKKRISRRRA